MKTIGKDDFNFFIPVEFEKAGKTDKDGLPEKLFIKGVASTSDEDSDRETLEPSGYDLNRFLRYGFLNLEHKAKQDHSFIVGEPVDAKVVNNELVLKGLLYKSNPKAVSIWKTAEMLKSEGSKRKLGFSIEGKAIERDPSNPRRITKAEITHCAITASPKNVNTFLDIMKGEYEEAFINQEFDDSADGGAVYLLDLTKPDGTRIIVDKEFNITVNKAMNAGHQTGRELTGKNTNGAALKTESLDKKMRNLQYEFKEAIVKIADQHKKKPFNDEILKKIKNNIKKFF
jgi:hypothetical protein